MIDSNGAGEGRYLTNAGLGRTLLFASNRYSREFVESLSSVSQPMLSHTLNVSRRTALKAGGLAMVIPGVHGSLSAAETKEKLRLAIIGVGGRGGANMGGVAGEHIVALCDINDSALDAAKGRFPDAKVAHDWRELMDDTSIDGVVISTADHHHAPASVAAMRAGKHVYCEKPLAHTVFEARMMQQEYTKRRGQIATQMGTQIHATDNYRRVVELVQANAIGTVTEAHVWCNRTISRVDVAELPLQTKPDSFHWDAWLGPAADRPYNEGYWKGGNLNWNRRWDFGNGVLGDMGSHLIDLPFWALKLTQPLTIQSQGPEPDPVQCPPWQEVTWEHGPRENTGPQSASVKVVWYHGPEGMRRRSEYLQPRVGSDTSINDWGIGVAFVGEGGVLVADYGKLVLSPAEKFKDFRLPPNAATIPSSTGHYAEWIQAAKSGGESLCNFAYSGALIEHNLLGNVAHRAGTKLEWNAEKLDASNAPQARAFISKEYRHGWEL